jgi:HCOMODA/2-hydroxy-3-carboxy-muconic semialdehyde decarboxylase
MSETIHDNNESRRQDLVTANHILLNEGVLDGFGHISVRDASNPNQFFIARSMAPGLVTLEDLVICDLDGNVIDSQNRRTYVERFIHSEIYRARPDVQSVIHSHSPALIPFGVMNSTSARLRPICHMSGFLGATTPVFEIRHSAGERSDLLIRNQLLGKALVESLGSAAVALLRGHGNVVVGTSIQQSVFRAINTEKNAHLQSQAMLLAAAVGAAGEVTYLTDGEAKAASDMNDEHLDRPWQMWKRQVGQWQVKID